MNYLQRWTVKRQTWRIHQHLASTPELGIRPCIYRRSTCKCHKIADPTYNYQGYGPVRRDDPEYSHRD